MLAALCAYRSRSSPATRSGRGRVPSCRSRRASSQRFSVSSGPTGPLPAGLVEGQAAGVPAGKCPADEVASLRKIGELAVVHPAVQVSLGEGDKGKLPALHEVKEVTAART